MQSFNGLHLEQTFFNLHETPPNLQFGALGLEFLQHVQTTYDMNSNLEMPTKNL
jgi:hypothetical protein